jgi:hypothetical protein
MRNLSHEAVRRALKKLLSGSADSAGIERISMAIRLRRGYCRRFSMRYHYSKGVQSIRIAETEMKTSKLSLSVEIAVFTSINFSS